MIVVDTNLVAYALIPGERTAAAIEVQRRDPEWVAPELLWVELRNLLAQNVRLRGLEPSDAVLVYREARELVRTVPLEPEFEQVLSLCTASAVSAYDAEFVVAARELGLPLVSADRRLVERCSDVAMSPERFVAGDEVHEETP